MWNARSHLQRQAQRTATDARVFVDRDAVEDAVTFVDVLMRSPGIELQTSGSEWRLVSEKLLSRRLHGNLITDAWIAAATDALSEHLVTFDRDFERLREGGGARHW